MEWEASASEFLRTLILGGGLFIVDNEGFEKFSLRRHCEERSDVAIQFIFQEHEIASLRSQ